MTRLPVYYFSHSHTTTGYGRAARDYIAALRAQGVEVIDLPLAEAADFVSGAIIVHHGSPAQIEELVKRAGWQEHGRHDRAKYVAVTAWEISEFPAEYARALSWYDSVLVPSYFTYEIVKRAMDATGDSVVRYPIVMPHCFDPAEWPLCDRDVRDDVYTFYTIEAWGERKNNLGVLRAYLHAFSRKDKTRLVMVLRDADFSVLRATIARSMLPADELPGLVVPDRHLSDDEIKGLHRECDCYVSATRGEGFGLGMFEAAISGRPVIAPGYGGQSDFLQHADWEGIDYQMTPCFAGEGKILEGEGVVGQNVRLPRGASAKMLWAEPDLEQLAESMRTMREAKIGRLSCGRGRDQLEAEFGRDEVGKKWVNLLFGCP